MRQSLLIYDGVGASGSGLESALSCAEDDRAEARSTMAFLGRGGRVENPGCEGYE